MGYRTLSTALIALILTVSGACAQDEGPIPFAGGAFTISENAYMEKVLAFDGKEIARDYFLSYRRTVEVSGVPVALFDMGPGGNACDTRTVMVWKPEGKDLQTAMAGNDCGSPAPAVTETAIYFVPNLLPGTSESVQVWTPDQGLKVAGTMSYAAQPGTSWETLDIQALQYPVDVFENADVLAQATSLLGDKLAEVALGLVVNDGFHMLDSGIFYSYGCVPHACGSSDAFIAIDMTDRKLYFAQQNGTGGEDTWPAIAEWPDDIRGAMQQSIGSNN